MSRMTETAKGRRGHIKGRFAEIGIELEQFPLDVRRRSARLSHLWSAIIVCLLYVRINGRVLVLRPFFLFLKRREEK